MLIRIAAAVLALTISSVATASAETDLLSRGDILTTADDGWITRRGLRDALRERGYQNFGPGGIRGHIWAITAYAQDGARYDIRVNARTRVVTKASLIRNFWY